MPENVQLAALPITEDDETIARALESASVGTLIMCIIHLTGDTSILDGPIRPKPAMMGEYQGFLGEEEQAAIRRQALDVLKAYRDGDGELPPVPSPETIHRMMSFLVGTEVPDEYVPMMLEEMALDGDDSRNTHLGDGAEAKIPPDFNVVIIGAGMSGLLTAIRLEEAGVPYVVIEKNDAVGGTWFENRYPGCRVDVANHFYCYSFEPNHQWSEYFSQRNELHDYFERVADKYGVRKRIRFMTEVVSAAYEEASSTWQVTVRAADGREETLQANVLVSAAGQLNRPKTPDLPGLETFRGPTFHSARWEHEHDLRGKRVAVVGTGASALQLVPEVAKEAAELFVFQRSPAWILPNPQYHAQVSEGLKWVLEHVPYYARWFRFLLFWPGSDGLMPSLEVDPDWPHPERSVNALNDMYRESITQFMAKGVGEDHDLLEHVVPTYPPFVKRILQDNGSWLSTLTKEHVQLVPEGVASVDANAVISESGKRFDVDVIVFATGFHANRFLWPMDIIGRGGKKLADEWGDDPGAYLGITIPDFPNLYCLYGPSTNLAHAGSIIFHSECQVRYVMGALRAMFDDGLAELECRRDVYEDYIERLDTRHAQLVWSHPGANSWYKNAKGRVTTTSPWRLVDYWGWTRELDLDDYRVSRVAGH